VLRARFEDAQFFYAADLATPLEALRPRLAGTLFHKDLGTLLDKADRVEALIAPLAAAAGLAGARPPGGARRGPWDAPPLLPGEPGLL